MKTSILVDGSNFYFKLKSLYSPAKVPHLDYALLASLLLQGDQVVELNYYIGKIRAAANDPKAIKMMADQQRIVTEIKKAGWNIKFGYLMLNNGHYSEKGVDVRIAVDIVSHACENTCEKIVLVSSDTDLIPAIEKAAEKGVDLEYVGFSHKKSWGMLKACKEARLLNKKDIDAILKKNP